MVIHQSAVSRSKDVTVRHIRLFIASCLSIMVSWNVMDSSHKSIKNEHTDV